MQAERRRQPRRGSLSTLRQSPIRNGLIGLAVAGTAAPIALNRHQQALRTDPSHEAMLAHGVMGADDSALRAVWQELEAAANNEQAVRETALQESLARYASYGLTRDLAEKIYDAAAENQIEPEIAFGLIRAESSFKNSATSPVGAVGLTQLMPRTAQWLEPGVTRAQLRDPGTNLAIGFKYLRSLIDKYEGDTKLALLAYNRGPGTVDRALKSGRNPDNGYADFVAGKEDHGHRLFTRS
jgi:soluble lytic murein transglycosylase-like protein